MKHGLSLISFLFSLPHNAVLLISKVLFFDGLVRAEALKRGNMLLGTGGYKGMNTVIGVTISAGFVAGIEQVIKTGLRVFMGYRRP